MKDIVLWIRRVLERDRQKYYPKMYPCYFMYSPFEEESEELRDKVSSLQDADVVPKTLGEAQRIAKTWCQEVPGRRVHIYESRMMYRYGSDKPKSASGGATKTRNIR